VELEIEGVWSSQAAAAALLERCQRQKACWTALLRRLSSPIVAAQITALSGSASLTLLTKRIHGAIPRLARGHLIEPLGDAAGIVARPRSRSRWRESALAWHRAVARPTPPRHGDRSTPRWTRSAERVDLQRTAQLGESETGSLFRIVTRQSAQGAGQGGFALLLIRQCPRPRQRGRGIFARPG